VIVNGDISSPEQAVDVLAQTGADALMIGRAAQGRPWIFREINHFMATGQRLAEPAPAEISRILSGHLENLYAFYGEYTGVRMARKHIAWYSKGQPEGNRFRQHINQTESAAAQLAYVYDYFAALTAQQALAA
jgi:tRNA-dihydrouridine synthase B